MNDLRLTVTGPSEEMDALEQFCQQSGLNTERGLISGYEGVAVTLFALYIVGGLEAVAQCLAAYHNARVPPLKLTYFVPAKGNMVVRDFSPEGIAKVLRVTDEVHVEIPEA